MLLKKKKTKDKNILSEFSFFSLKHNSIILIIEKLESLRPNVKLY
jgi:hypothetical protein